MDLRRTLSQLLEHRDEGQAAAERRTPPEGFMRTGSTSSASSRDLRTPRDACGFCRQNGETPVVYMSHRLKARDGRILCPILRSYVCPFCSATGQPLLSTETQPQTGSLLNKKSFRRCGKHEHVPDDLLIALRFVFGPCAVQALDLVDQRSVTCVSSPSGRNAFTQVLGGSGHLYTCFTSCHYCPCPAFSISVLRRNESLMCKHLLAACLSLCQQEQVSDQQMTHILSGQTEAST